MSAHLNRERPYGQIYGIPPVPGARYEQDGRFFRADGSPVGEPEPPPEPRRGPGRPRKEDAARHAMAAIYGDDA